MNIKSVSIKLVVLAAISILLVPLEAAGWDCHRDTEEWWFATSDLVFEGRAIKKELVEYDSYPVAVNVTFGDLRVYKGDQDAVSAHTLTVRTGLFGDSPGFPFICGEEYIIYASRYPGSDSYHTDVCRPTRAVSDTVPGYDDLEGVLLANSPDIPESRKKEVRDKYNQACPEWKAPPVGLKWRFRAEGGFNTSPVITGKTVLFGSRAGILYAVDVDSGEELWKFKAGDSIRHKPVVHGRTVYFGSSDGYLYAVDIDSGRVIWQYGTGDIITSSPFIKDGAIYIGNDAGIFFSISASSGRKKWDYKTGGRIETAGALKDIVFAGSIDDNLYAIDTDTGKLKWKFKAGNAVNFLMPAGKRVYVLSGLFSGNNIYSIDSDKQEKKWEQVLEASAAQYLYFRYGKMYLIDSDGFINVLDMRTGEREARINTGIYFGYSPVDDATMIGDDGTLYIGHDTYLHAIDVLTGKLKWRYRTAHGNAYSIREHAGTIYFSSWDYLYALTVMK